MNRGVESKVDGLKGAPIQGPLGGEQFYFNKKEIDKYKGAAKTAGGLQQLFTSHTKRTQKWGRWLQVVLLNLI